MLFSVLYLEKQGQVKLMDFDKHDKPGNQKSKEGDLSVVMIHIFGA